MGIVDNQSLHAQSDIEIPLAVIGDAAHSVGYLPNLLCVDEFVLFGQGVVMVYAPVIVCEPDGGICRHADVGDAPYRLAVYFEMREGLGLAVKDVCSSVLGVHPYGVALRMIKESYVFIVGNSRVARIEHGTFVAGDTVESPFRGDPYESLSVDDHIIYESVG